MLTPIFLVRATIPLPLPRRRKGKKFKLGGHPQFPHVRKGCTLLYIPQEPLYMCFVVS